MLFGDLEPGRRFILVGQAENLVAKEELGCFIKLDDSSEAIHPCGVKANAINPLYQAIYMSPDTKVHPLMLP